MVTMSEAAQCKTKEMLSEEGPCQYLRLFVEAGGCSGFQYGLAYETEKQENDQSFPFDGFELLIDPNSYIYLADADIDYAESLHGGGFSIKNPKAKSTCGCGKSSQF